MGTQTEFSRVEVGVVVERFYLIDVAAPLCRRVTENMMAASTKRGGCNMGYAHRRIGRDCS